MLFAATTLEKLADATNFYWTMAWLVILGAVAGIAYVSLMEEKKNKDRQWPTTHYDDYWAVIQAILIRLAITGAVLNLIFGLGEAALFKKGDTSEATGFSGYWEWHALRMEFRWGTLIGVKVAIYLLCLIQGIELGGALPRLPHPHERWMEKNIFWYLVPKHAAFVFVVIVFLSALLGTGSYVFAAVEFWCQQNRGLIRFVSVILVIGVLLWLFSRQPSETWDVLKDLFSFQKTEDESYGQYLLSEAVKVVVILLVMFALMGAAYFLTNWVLEATIGRAINDWKRGWGS